jgi:NYN domain
VDRCALFVDAGYVLADGAMAVHGTPRRESVSWDYAGLTQFLSGMASERSGLPLLRCYWYEATVEGRPTEEHDTLADLPGVKLRLAKMRPGRREGVESEIHRDLTTLARNKAVTDAMVVSAEEDLAQVVADVQDLGMRVTLLHIAVDGNGEIPRALRQECDDIAEISGADLRPYVELISGAEPPRTDEQDGGSLIVFRPATNGHGQPEGAALYASAPQETDNGYQTPSAYQEPAGTLADAPEPPAPLDLAPAALDVQQEEQQDVQQEQQQEVQQEQQDAQPLQPQPVQQEPLPAQQQEPLPARQEVAAEEDRPAAPVEPAAPAAEYFGVPSGLAVVQPEQGQGQPSPFSPADPQEYAVRPDWPAGPEFTPRPEVYGAPVAVPAPPAEPVVLPAARNRATDLSGYRPGAIRMQPPRDPVSREPLPAEPGDGYQPAPASAQVHRLPARGVGQPAAAPPPPPLGMPEASGVPGVPGPAGSAMPPPPPGQPMSMQPPQGQPLQGQPLQGQPGIGQPAVGPFAAPQPEAGPFAAPQPEAGPFAAPQQEAGQPPLAGPPPAGQYGVPAPVTPMVPDVGYPAHDAGHTAPRNGSYTGPRPVAPLGSGGGAPAAPWGQPPVGGLNGPSAPSGPIGPGAPVGLGGYQGPPSAITPQADPGGQPGPGPGVPGVPGGPLGPAGPAYSAAQPGVSLADAVQSAHREGQEFGESVARDAPALWLEAVLARKPRMPSDLEARLLQGSALPIDFLLHDEVRHALRRGFWDALERARR